LIVAAPAYVGEREFFIDNLLVRIYFIIEMIFWTGLAPWEFEFPVPCSLISTFRRLHPRHLSVYSPPIHAACYEESIGWVSAKN